VLLSFLAPRSRAAGYVRSRKRCESDRGGFASGIRNSARRGLDSR
jgi:hypothetical protein